MSAALSAKVPVSLPEGAWLAPPEPERQVIRFTTAAAWHAALGGVPLERVRLVPAPGTATAEDALVASEQKPLVELVHGTLVEKTMGFRESQIAAAMIFLLSAHVRPRKLGGVFGADALFRMPGGNVRLPDVSFVQEDRLPEKLMPVTELCPDLAIEVLSRGNTKAEIDQKRRELFAGGTRLMWIVDARAATAVIYTRPDEADEAITIDGYLDGGDVLPGFRVALSEVFEGIHEQG